MSFFNKILKDVNNLFDSFDRVVKYGYESLMKVDGVKNLSSDSINKIKSHIRKTAIENTKKRLSEEVRPFLIIQKIKLIIWWPVKRKRLLANLRPMG